MHHDPLSLADILNTRPMWPLSSDNTSISTVIYFKINQLHFYIATLTKQ